MAALAPQMELLLGELPHQRVGNTPLLRLAKLTSQLLGTQVLSKA